MAESVPVAPPIPIEAKLADRLFFLEHADRKRRIRLPVGEEYRNEFRQFGWHDEGRRRVIVARIAAGLSKRHNVDFIRIPFLLFSDETVEDRDDVLAPFLDEIMRDAQDGYGMKRR